jgi:hypothetical protein
VVIAVLDNDADPEGGPLTLVSATASSGTATIQGDGTLSYTAPVGFTGTATVTYTIRDAAGATDDGSVAVIVTPAISISNIDTTGDFTVAADEDDFVLTVVEPSEYVGNYTIRIADLDGGPVNFVAPKAPGGTAPGDMITTIPGLWAYEEADGTIEFSRQWYRGADPIDGATGGTYTVQEGDEAEGIRFLTQASNNAGIRSVELEVIARAVSPAITVPAVRFDGSVRMIRYANLGVADSSAVFGFADFVPLAVQRHGILRQRSAKDGLEIWDGVARFAFNVAVLSRPLSAGQRTRLVGVSHFDGTSTRTAIYSRLGDQPEWLLDQEILSQGNVVSDLTYGGFTVGGRHAAPGTDQNLRADVYRIACWTETIPDITAAGIFEAFVRPDGSLEDPEISRSRFGIPRVDVFGSKEDLAAGINRGTAGNFDIIEGSFPDA